MTLVDDRRSLLREIRHKFGVDLLHLVFRDPGVYLPDASSHVFYVQADEQPPTEATKREIRRFVEDRGWAYSRDVVPLEEVPGETREYIYLAPMVYVALGRAYHVTRLASVASILASGLLPSTPDRQTTAGRYDCEGNIYVCERLGTSDDVGVLDSFSAHYWRGRLAQENRFKDPDWVILEVNLGRLKGARIYKDMWSKSGVIVGGVDRIAPEFIRIVWPEGDT